MKYLDYLVAGNGIEPSPPSRGAWIEIYAITGLGLWCEVAPLAGGVD